jgi:hypothetical protein
MEAEQLKVDLRSGRIQPERLVDLVVMLERELLATREELERANRRIDELEKKLGGSPPAKISEPFSVRSEEKRQEARGKRRRKRKRGKKRGRKTTAGKVALAERIERVFPKGVPETDCWLSHTRPVWRLEQGRALLVAYEVYRGPNNQYGKIPGVLGRSEFGLEVVLAVAFQVYVLGLPFEKVCLLMGFFQNLKLSKAQVNALLYQLARHWEEEFDVLCELLANSLVVQADETGWSINSVWAFLSEKVRVVLFGVHKDGATLLEVLDPATFAGIVVSDDAAVYSKFTRSQKCWAHLLRKAIKLTLMDPANARYRRLTDRLLEIYHTACRVQRDRRLSDDGRKKKVAVLEGEVCTLCGPTVRANLPPSTGPANDYRLLCEELIRLTLDEQLFTFVTAEPAEQPNGNTMVVPGTNNESERTLRSPAQARDTGRTNKAISGARRQTVIVSVLESLRLHLATFTLSSVIEEVGRWAEAGRSCFARLAEKLELRFASTATNGRSSLLNRLLPAPER